MDPKYMFDINSVGSELGSNLDELGEKIYYFSVELGSEENKPPDVIKDDLNEIIPTVNKMIDLLDPFVTNIIRQDVEITGQKNPNYDGDAYRCFIAGIKVGNLLPELNAIKELKDVKADDLAQYDLNNFIWGVHQDIERTRSDLYNCPIFKKYIKSSY
jgi:hypothetical protein